MLILTIMAVASWCAMAYMVPIVWWMVWNRRRKDPTEIIQEDDGEPEPEEMPAEKKRCVIVGARLTLPEDGVIASTQVDTTEGMTDGGKI